MRAIVCALASGVGLYFSLGLGEEWWLAWLAPIPVLWFAFGDTKGWQIFVAAFAAMALGSSSILRAYGGVLPNPVLVLAIGAPSLQFAASVVAARRVQRTLGPLAAMLAFAALWAALDFLASFNQDGGAVGTPAAAEVGRPVLIQTASLFGFVAITFLIGIVSAGIALGLRTRDSRLAGIAIAVFAINAALGLWRMSTPPSDRVHVALIESDETVGSVATADRVATFQAVDAYVAMIETLREAHVRLIVLPENISRVAPQWRMEVQAKLAAAADRAGATIVAGFNTERDGVRHNIAWAFTPGNSLPSTYEKRRLVPVLESSVYRPGSSPQVLSSGIGLEICKDMDYPAMLRSDQIATRPILLAVPAWDFGADGWLHARDAILRSVENGVPTARSARRGLLTLNDRYGRLVARARTVGGFTVLVDDLPLGGRGGDTVYDHIGDVFGWFCVLSGSVLVAWAFARRAP